MRFLYLLLSSVAVLIGMLIVVLVVVRAVHGPMNVLMPGSGLVIALAMIIAVLFVLEALIVGLAMAVRSSRNRDR